MQNGYLCLFDMYMLIDNPVTSSGCNQNYRWKTGEILNNEKPVDESDTPSLLPSVTDTSTDGDFQAPHDQL
ncbi:hypothetical protein BTVI_130811 [Pitangus sulphuratus]|nr:hypothetical protein BTVI_130811 [Pitangus sulphuratus]